MNKDEHSQINQKQTPLPAIVCLTSAECIHCLLTRGEHGKLLINNEVENQINYSSLWSSSFFKSLLTVKNWIQPSSYNTEKHNITNEEQTENSKDQYLETVASSSETSTVSVVTTRVFNIHFSTLSADRVIEACEFRLLDSSDGKKVSVKHVMLNPETDVPPAYALLPFAVSYPSWFCVKGSDWDLAVAARIGSHSPGELRGTLLYAPSSNPSTKLSRAVLTLRDAFSPPVYVIPVVDTTANPNAEPNKTTTTVATTSSVQQRQHNSTTLQMHNILQAVSEELQNRKYYQQSHYEESDEYNNVHNGGSIRFIRPIYDSGRVR